MHGNIPWSMLYGILFQSRAYYMLQAHNKHYKVTYNNSYLELKVSGFYKSLFSKDFTELLHLL